MFQDPDFVQQYIDRWFELRQTTFSNENLFATIDKHASEIGDAAQRDYANWLGARFGGTFEGEIDHLKDWLQTRVEWIDSQWMSAPTSDSPDASGAGQLPAGSTVNLSTGPGVVYYTLDGTDPRGDNGAIRSKAIQASGPITIGAGERLFARRYQSGFGGRHGYVETGDDWSSPLRIAAIGEAASVANLAITEIHFNPADANVFAGEVSEDNDEFEFLEFTNIGTLPVELADVQLVEADVDGDDQGVRFTFETQTLQPGESLVVVENVEAFQSRYGDDIRIAVGADDPGDIAGQYGGKLSNGGERLTLLAADGNVIRQIDYDDWYEATDGGGESLIVVDVAIADAPQLASPSSWQPSGQRNGTPGIAGLNAPGDFDNSGTFDIKDVDLYYAAVMGPMPPAEYDLTNDGSVNQDDLDFLIEDVLETRAGDTNLDGRIDFVDFLALSANFGQDDRDWTTGDFDADGSVGFTDFLALSENFGFARN